jgi:hypothetical protein
MKRLLSLLALTLGTVAFSLSQTGCAGVYVEGPGPAYYGPSPAVAWGGAGFYGGTYYGTRAAYYRGGAAYRTSWSNGGYYRSPRGSASWHNGSGSASGWRGGSASWSHGSGSWSGPRGRSGSWHR